MRIGLLSDTHGWIHPSIRSYFNECDEIWHAGDIGNLETARILESMKPLKAVSGNIDGTDIRAGFPARLRFVVEGTSVLMTHIGGYPGHYDKEIFEVVKNNPPDLLICGHSHILRIIYDEKFGMLTINPGAAGYKGFHKVMTITRFSLTGEGISNLEIIELGERSRQAGGIY